MSQIADDRSYSMGFWAQHCSAMEAFEYQDEEPVPEELQSVFSDPESRSLLHKIVDNATNEGNNLVHSIVNALEIEWGKDKELVTERGRKPDAWEEKMRVRRKYARAGKSAEIGVSIQAADSNDLQLFCYLWTRGGKQAAIENDTCVRNHYCKQDTPHGEAPSFLPRGTYWANGVILLATSKLLDFVEDGYLDTKRISENVISQALRCRAAAMVEILSARYKRKVA